MPFCDSLLDYVTLFLNTPTTHKYSVTGIQQMLLSPLSYSVGGHAFIAIQICLNDDPFANMYAHNYKSR